MRWLWFVLCLALPAWGGCEPPTTHQTGLTVRDGYLDFMTPSVVKDLKTRLPRVGDTETETRLKAADTIWYDEESMVYLYQDSIEVVVGGRANCVGREVGETNTLPAIHKLVNYFGPDYRFMFPFRTAAGTDDVTNVKVINFWSPPLKGGRALPVKYWRPTGRGRWNWTFPVGTLFGEVLLEKGPDGNYYAFEVRTRKRYLDGWEVNAFRPFPRAEDLANAIEAEEPDWGMSVDLRKLVTHLRNPATLVPDRMESKPYGKIFPTIEGAIDPLPGIANTQLIATLLSKTVFVSAEGKIWKENGKLQSYAAGSQADFHIVPKGYKMGLIPVNEVSCARCHSETGRRLGDLEFDIQLYGEVWGEDRIFTWHLFEPNPNIFGTYDDADKSRVVNPRLLTAKLLVNEKPASGDPDYKPLPGVFKPESRRRAHE